MNKKILIVLVLILLLVVGCNKESAALKFKSDYESINGLENKNGKKHREVSIDEDNPFMEVTPSKLLEMIENKETFYVYFGDKLCPWCRSVIEKAIEVSQAKKIKKIYYISIWDDEGNEILRDKYELQDGKPVKVIDGSEEYQKFLEYFDNVLSEYNLTDSDGNKVSTGEKRIYAPNFIYVENGKTIRLTEGISENQKDSREDLSKEILEDEEELFNEFFK